MSNLSPDAQAILLLTARFGKADQSNEKPLSAREWGELAVWLKANGLRPSGLMQADHQHALQSWQHRKLTPARVAGLLNRGTAMAFALEKWQRTGIWVVVRSDADYPQLLKKRLGHAAPPFFYGAGNRKLLNQKAIAVVGSRKVSDADLQYARGLGARIANAACAVVSGGARGTDEASMLGALEVDGTAIGVMANNLLSASTSAQYRPHLRAGNLLLLSPFNPEARFQAWAAMARNAYIYCLSEAAVAVHSGTTGGTWEGVRENLKHGWVPVWVKQTDDPSAGNQALVEQGAHALPADLAQVSIPQLAAKTMTEQQLPPQQPLLAGEPEPAPMALETKTQVAKTTTNGNFRKEVQATADTTSEDAPANQPASIALSSEPDKPAPVLLSVYDYFLYLLANVCTQSRPVTELHNMDAFKDMRKVQLDAWLKRADKEGRVTRVTQAGTDCVQWLDGEMPSRDDKTPSLFD